MSENVQSCFLGHPVNAPQASRSTRQRSRSYEDGAKELLRALTQDSSIGSSSGGSSGDSPMKKPLSEESDWEPEMPVAGLSRSASLETMRYILGMHERKASERTIKAKYPWFNRRYIQRFRDYVGKNGPNRSKMQQVNDYVQQRALETRDSKKPLHEYMLRIWGTRRAAEVRASNFAAASDKWIHTIEKRIGLSARKVTKTVSLSAWSH